MKKVYLLIILCFTIILSFGASAVTKENMKKDNYNGLFTDRETKQTYFYKDGDIVANSWIDYNGQKYYFKEDGTMLTGWKYMNNNWYCFGKEMGIMLTGWVSDGPNWYYLNADGTMVHDTYIDGYYLGTNGAWVK